MRGLAPPYLQWSSGLTRPPPATQVDRQGNDKGTQYASVIFTHTAEQNKTARARVAALQKALDDGGWSVSA